MSLQIDACPAGDSSPLVSIQQKPHSNLRKKTGSYSRISSWVRLVMLSFGGGYWCANMVWTVQQQSIAETNPNNSLCLPTQQQQQQYDFPSLISKKSFIDTETNPHFSEPHQSIHDQRHSTSSEEEKEIEDASPMKNLPVQSITNTTFSQPTNVIPNSSPTMTAHMIDKVPLDPTTGLRKASADPFWWKHHIHELARPWKSRSMDSWCQELLPFPPPLPLLLRPNEEATGLIYIKVYKASSSTMEGVARSIAHHVGTRLSRKRKQQLQLLEAIPTNNTVNNIEGFVSSTRSSSQITCRAWTRHEFADNRMHGRRHPTRSLLWTFVRNPAARDLSHIFHFEVGRKGLNMTFDDIQAKIQGYIKGKQTRKLLPYRHSRAPLWPLHELRKNQTAVIRKLKAQIFENYDFLGLTERMTESLACMVLLWDLHPQDVIVLSAKRSGGYDDGGFQGGMCIKIPKVPPFTPKFKDYLENRHSIWNSDSLLYHAANASLEMTIEALGRDRVQTMTRHIEHLQQIAEDQCQELAHFPCSPEGIFQPLLSAESCYVQDSGCGYECVHRNLANATQGIPK